VKPGSDIRGIGEEVVEKLRRFALPWFAKATSLEEAPKMARPAEAVVLLAMKGEQAKATALLADEIAKSKHAKPFLRSLAERLNLQIPMET
jgi:hypothetical protein